MPSYEVISPQVACPTCSGAGYVRKDSRADKLCLMKLPYFHDIYVTFTFHVSYTILWQNFDAYLTIMPLVDCYPTNMNISNIET
ncbi:uncharacterized protein DC041_0005796 [Schistosoma bovis]|uniref:Uncharacterized protein n=1 Tax=Schistosoma bovis TaxID=6184 RepID=A0A430QJ63_SCHBO|nr:uncharacterized protein DC041_0005796 [Schistosoma bovis]